MNPRNMGDLKDADGVGEVGAAACGDIMKISLKIKDGRIDAFWKGELLIEHKSSGKSLDKAFAQAADYQELVVRTEAGSQRQKTRTHAWKTAEFTSGNGTGHQTNYCKR